MPQSSTHVKPGIRPGIGNSLDELPWHIVITLVVNEQARKMKLAHHVLGGSA
ncbi:MAG: hypothetical protein BMS9Abin36_1600 [Gammaproteobacteria bacterium]|nr:MAG: hypothetical protein BMS9Abin36_1600 [Gammaproteobacteria bacterium]